MWTEDCAPSAFLPTNRMTLSTAPSPRAPRVSADEAIAAAAPWSAPLLSDVLTVESLGEDLDAAALGVALALLALLDEHTVPGWLPALLDEQRTPISGLMPPIPSFCFTDDHGVVPIGVVRPMPHAPHILAGTTSASQPSTPSDSEFATRRCTNTSRSWSSVSA